MSFTIETQITCYLLPGDGQLARAELLQHLLDPGETWIIAYAFTLPQIINELLIAHQKGVPLHLYLDHSQEISTTEQPLIQRLATAGIEVTIGTSPVGLEYICHTKGMVSDPSTEGQLWCWEGSTNFSIEAWNQVNTAMVFSSIPWRNAFVAQFNTLRAFAWTKERGIQVMKQPPPL